MLYRLPVANIIDTMYY